MNYITPAWTRFKRFITSYRYSIPTAIVILIVIFIATRGGSQMVKSETVTVGKSTVAQEVSVTGRVVPAHEVDLAVQSGGKVVAITAVVGKEVTAGQTVLRVDDADLRIRLGRQQAALAKAKLAFSKQEPEAGNAEGDLKKAYEDGFNTVADTFLDLPSIITGLDEMLNDSSHSPHLDQESIRPLGQTALDMRRDVVRMFDLAEVRFDTISAKYKTLNRNASSAELEAILNETYEVTKNIADVVKSTRNLVDYIENKSNTNSQATTIDADQSTLDSYTQETNSHLSAILGIKNTIKDSRDAINNESSDTTSSSIDIRQAELDIQDTVVQINNRTIKAPAAGVVTKVNAEVGETVSPSTPVISIISANQYEIEANVPEADMARLTVGADTDVTLDAYGSEVIFKAKVVSIDPSETIVDGVATYITKFQFVDKDDRIKSGMTASIIVQGERKENVLAIPQRAVVTKDGKKMVKVESVDGKTITEKEVVTGLRGSDGSIEIVSGLIEGDKVVVFTETK